MFTYDSIIQIDLRHIKSQNTTRNTSVYYTDGIPTVLL